MLNIKTDIDRDFIKDWSSINWITVNKSMTNLRRRIFDAKQKGNYKNLVNVQKLMLNSKANILYSIRKISYNSGKRTPGIDRETLESPQDRLRLYNEICENGWNGRSPKPIRRIYIKEGEKLRPIGIPTVYDRVIQCMVANSLEPEWEAIFEKESYGFRPKRNTNDAVSRVWLALNKPTSRKWIVDSDITKCFDTISHSYLLEKLKGFPGRDLIEEMLEVGIITNGVWMESADEGTPQGSTLSPLLCNIALHGVEAELGVIYTKKGYVNSKGRLLIRFADDLVIICHTKEDAMKALDELKEVLIKRGLQISEIKTKIVHVSEGFDFLGYNIRMLPKIHKSWKQSIVKLNDNDYLINYNNVGIYVAPSRKSITKVKSNLKEVLMSCKGSTAEKFIDKINPIIRGYALAKRHWHSNKAFREIDYYVYTLCWRWAIRKHPKKGAKWIKKKYFHTLKLGYINNKWVFTAERAKVFKPKDPTNPFINKITNPLVPVKVFVYKLYWFGIRDYRVGKMDKLPDNRADAAYYKELEANRMSRMVFNIFRKLDKDLAMSQHGICPICNADLFNGEKLHIHHIQPRETGGKTTFINLLYVHIACHQKIHSNKENFNHFFNMLKEYKRTHTRLSNEKLSTGEYEMPQNEKLKELF
uniref:Reverse transcriptase domain-containing protein n=1 Tax=Cryptoglena skujai TaxID=161229 RepID=A0A0G3SGR8_9EUGL|nr:hypothetical protein [Cryptoglena skujai]AKL39015.1 hypothetical protein [Cryptoglena skujai]